MPIFQRMTQLHTSNFEVLYLHIRVCILAVPRMQSLCFSAVLMSSMLCENVRKPYLQECNAPSQSAYQYNTTAIAQVGPQADTPTGYCSSMPETVLPGDKSKDGSFRSSHVQHQQSVGGQEATFQQQPVEDITQKPVTLGLCDISSSDSMGLEVEELQRALGAFSESRLHQYTQQLEAATEVNPLAALSAISTPTDGLPQSDTTNDDATADGVQTAAGGSGPREHPACEAGAAGNRPAADSSGRAAELQEDNAWMDQYRREAVQRYADRGWHGCSCSFVRVSTYTATPCIRHLHPSQLPAAWLWILPSPRWVFRAWSVGMLIWLRIPNSWQGHGEHMPRTREAERQMYVCKSLNPIEKSALPAAIYFW